MSRCTRCDKKITSGYVLCSRCYEQMNALIDAAVMQEEYRRLTAEKKLSKKAICALCVPFRDKYGLTDLQTLRIAREEMSLMEMLQQLDVVKEERFLK